MRVVLGVVFWLTLLLGFQGITQAQIVPPMPLPPPVLVPPLQPQPIITAGPLIVQPYPSSAPPAHTETLPPLEVLRTAPPAIAAETSTQVANFEACNYYSFPILIAVAFTYQGELATQGWKRLDPGCSRVGIFPFQHKYFGYFATSRDGHHNWNGDTYLCLDTTQGFWLPYADRGCPDGYVRRPFAIWTPERLHPDSVVRQADYEQVIRINFAPRNQ